MNVGKNITKLRKEKKLTQEDLGKLINVSPKTISSYENNHNLPNIEILILLSEVFNVTIDKLIGTTKEDKIEVKERYEKKTNKGMIISLAVSLYSILFFFIFNYMISGSIILTSAESSMTVRDLTILLSKFTIIYTISLAFIYFWYYFENKKTKVKIIMFTTYFVILFILMLLIIFL